MFENLSATQPLIVAACFVFFTLLWRLVRAGEGEDNKNEKETAGAFPNAAAARALHPFRGIPDPVVQPLLLRIFFFSPPPPSQQRSRGDRLWTGMWALPLKGFHTERCSFFSTEHVPLQVVRDCVRAAGTAPSGAHCQPWTFMIVANEGVKQQIRELVEREEQVNYDRRMKREWVSDVSNLVSNLHGPKDEHTGSTDVKKPYLTEAPYLVVLLKQNYRLDDLGNRTTHYYQAESCGIAAGVFVTALHNANLSTLTSTPMGAEREIRKILGRPDHEKVFLLLPVGWPAKDATVPHRDRETLRLPLDEYCHVIE